MMSTAKKITVHVPEDLLRRAQEVTGEGITPTIRRALRLVAASRSYEDLQKLRGRVDLTVDLDVLREDRS